MSAWAKFWALGLIWGSSYLFIRIAVEAMHPFFVVFIRVGIAAVGLFLVSMVLRKRIPTDWKTLGALIIIGIGNVVMPYNLITWGEQTVDSGITAVLQATTALFALVVAHFAFQDERINRRKVAGLLIGFVGIVILASRSWADGTIEESSFLGQMAIVLSSLFYAIFTSYSRKLIQQDLEPIVLAAFTMLVATVVEGFLIWGLPDVPNVLPAGVAFDGLMAVLILGVFNTFLAYILFYDIVKDLGAARAGMVTYVLPPVGLFLGVVFLNEVLDLQIILGSLLIFSGIGIANLPKFRRQKVSPVAVGAGD